MSEKNIQLESLRKECLSCRKCSIGGQQILIKDKTYISNVFSNMCMKAQIMVVGNNPGATEVLKATPFIGPSGKSFDKAVKEVLGVDRTYFYICNSCCCFTPANRCPSDEEVANCRYFLDKEVDIIKPKLIITLGSLSMKTITGRTGIMKNHGKKLVSLRYGVEVIPMLHPSPLNLLREENRKLFYEDFELIKPYLS